MLLECFSSPQTTLLSFVICSVDDRRFLAVSESIRKNMPENWHEAKTGMVAADIRFEIIRISDARSLAEGYNRGYEMSKGNLVIFCHDDIEIISRNFILRLLRHCISCDVMGLCGTTRLISGNWYDAGPPYVHGAVISPSHVQSGGFQLQVFGRNDPPLKMNAQALDGIFICAHRKVIEALQGFNERDFNDFYCYDIDFSFRAHLANFRVGIPTDLLVYHASNPAFFSEGKIARWRQSMAIFVDKYQRYLCSDRGSRAGHTNYEFVSLEAARDFYEQ